MLTSFPFELNVISNTLKFNFQINNFHKCSALLISISVNVMKFQLNGAIDDLRLLVDSENRRIFKSLYHTGYEFNDTLKNPFKLLALFSSNFFSNIYFKAVIGQHNRVVIEID